MDIKWLGKTSFHVNAKKVNVVTDPQDDKVKADIVLKTEDSDVNSGEMTIDWPGEYESKDVLINAAPIGTGNDEQRIISFEVDGIRFCAVPQVEAAPGEKKIGELGDVDVVFMPMTVKPKIALEIIEEIDPRMVILSAMDIDGSTMPEFLKEVGQTGLSPEDKVSISSKSSLDSENVVYKYMG
jgi:L-ascorbate metabolism protein UlaG (beta-lactamase superfamily)